MFVPNTFGEKFCRCGPGLRHIAKTWLTISIQSDGCEMVDRWATAFVSTLAMLGSFMFTTPGLVMGIVWLVTDATSRPAMEPVSCQLLVNCFPAWHATGASHIAVLSAEVQGVAAISVGADMAGKCHHCAWDHHCNRDMQLEGGQCNARHIHTCEEGRGGGAWQGLLSGTWCTLRANLKPRLASSYCHTHPGRFSVNTRAIILKANRQTYTVQDTAAALEATSLMMRSIEWFLLHDQAKMHGKDDIFDETSGEDSNEDVSDTVQDIPSTNAVKKAEGINNARYIFPENPNELWVELEMLSVELTVELEMITLELTVVLALEVEQIVEQILELTEEQIVEVENHVVAWPIYDLHLDPKMPCTTIDMLAHANKDNTHRVWFTQTIAYQLYHPNNGVITHWTETYTYERYTENPEV
ncbi:hypothetical protein PR048_011715 [Dryococelus australis]|uniref:Uncharacterized protein n=1 Tax=Dryococelus australis TaxID=614101 RepID=A0ABQ9HMP0_9NEOP|nr:hypothetical protein PR048_011715 [Dryococelus australis]